MQLMILRLALAVSLLGILTSTIFLILALLGALNFLRNAHQERARYSAAEVDRPNFDLPPVSVLKPVHGLEARLKENIESFFRQQYPGYEILFAADEEQDPALPVIREICARYPHVPSRILVTGQPPWPNAPNYCFHRLTEVASHNILVTSDSDVEVDANYLREVVPPLLDPKVGAVTCIFRGKNAGGFWAWLDAIGMSVEFTAGVLTANLLEGMKFGLGPTIALRKDSLAKIGGYAAIREYLSNDFVVCNFIEKSGYTIVLSSHVVDHISPPMTFHKMWERQLRWAMGSRYSRPKGHIGTGLVFAAPYGLLALVAASLLGHPVLGIALFGFTFVSRAAESWIIGWVIARDVVARRQMWMYPLRDLLGFVIWCASYLSKRSLWRDNQYELLKGGRLVARRANGSVITPG